MVNDKRIGAVKEILAKKLKNPESSSKDEPDSNNTEPSSSKSLTSPVPNEPQGSGMPSQTTSIIMAMPFPY